MPLSDYDQIFQSAAQEWNVDPVLLKSLAMQESSGNPKAVSKVGAFGLTGIMPDTAKGLGVTDPSDTVQQIYAGAKYLSEGLDKEDTPEKALLYYHGGPEWRQKYGPESAGYVPAVTAHYKKFSAAQQPAETPTSPAAHSDMSDADFLKSTGGGSSAPTVEDDAAFLARTGGKAAAPTAAQAEPSPVLDDYGRPVGSEAVPAPIQNTVNATVEGAKEGFGSGPIGWSPENVAAYQRAGIIPPASGGGTPMQVVNQAVLSPLAAVGNLGTRVGHALMGAYQHGVSQAGAALGQPLLGRDLAGVPEAFPTGDLRGGTLLHAPLEAPAATPARPRLVSEAFAPAPVPGQSALDRMTQLIAHDNAEAAGVRNEVQPNALAAAPATGTSLAAASIPQGWLVDDRFGPGAARQAGPITSSQVQKRDGVGYNEALRRANAENAAAANTPAPNSVGAAASASAEAGLTPKQELAYRSTAEGQKLLEPQTVGAQDRNQYVYGSNPNSAEIEQSVITAREQKALGLQSPEVSQEAREVAQENNDARSQHFAQTAGSDVDVQNAKDTLAEQDKTMLAKAWESKADADAQPVLDLAAQIKTSPDGRRPIVRGVLDSVTKELYDDDGKLLTDPEQLYGVRKHIDDLLDEVDSAGKPKYARAQSALLGMKSALDEAIEPAADGFGDYLKAHASDAKRIDEMTALQGFENKLYDASSRMTYPKVQTMMRQIVDARQSPGLNKFKSITDDTMARLWALRDDLRRSASAQELARTPGGSDSAQNFWDIAKGVGKSAADLGVHGAILGHTGPLGNVVYSGIRNAVANKLQARSAQKQTARGMDLLRPKTELHNPLASP